MRDARKAELNQYFTPVWAAERLLQRHFADLGPRDTVLEPSCGDGRFLMAVPACVAAYGVEIDPHWAACARVNSGRDVLEGDFTQIILPRPPTVIVGNPPFKSSLIDAFLARCHDILEYGGRVGFVLPVYYMQTASVIVRLQKQFSISQEMLPRNIFQNMEKPIMWAMFTKEKRTFLSGFFLYEETAALADLNKEAKQLVVGNTSSPTCWRDAVTMALESLGGRANLQQIYQCLEKKRPSENPWWREQIRKVAGQHFVRIGAGEYALPAMAMEAA